MHPKLFVGEVVQSESSAKVEKLDEIYITSKIITSSVFKYSWELIKKYSAAMLLFCFKFLFCFYVLLIADMS